MNTADGLEKIAGIAIWERQGDDGVRKSIEQEWADFGKKLQNVPSA